MARKYFTNGVPSYRVYANGVLQFSRAIEQFAAKVVADGGTVDPVWYDQYAAQHQLIKKEARAVLLPGAHKAGLIYGIDLTTGDLVPFTFARAGVATYFDKNGIMQTAPANVPRIDYDPVTKVCRGYLQEKSSTNLCVWSNDLLSGTWAFIGSPLPSRNQQTSVAPDGSLIQGYNMTDSVLYQDVASTDGQAYCSSIWIKTNIPTVLGFRKLGASNTNGSGLDSDLKVNTTTEWQRVSVNDNSVGTVIRILLDNRAVRGYNTANNLIVWLWGAQIELGTQPTSNITTTTSQVTRPADTLQSVNDIVPYAEASVYYRYSPTYTQAAWFLDKTGTGRFIYSNLGTPNIIANYNGSLSSSINGMSNIGGDNRAVSSYGNAGLKMSGNGSVGVNPTPQSTPFGSSGPIYFGSQNRNYSNYIKAFAVFSRQLTSAEHISITV